MREKNILITPTIKITVSAIAGETKARNIKAKVVKTTSTIWHISSLAGGHIMTVSSVETEQEENGWTEVNALKKHNESVPSTSSSRPSSSRRSSKSKRGKKTKPKIAFSCTSHYHPLLWVIAAIPLLSILTRIVLVSIDSNVDDIRREYQAWKLTWSLILVFIIYMVILPRRVDVRSNGSIGVKTFLITYLFGDVVRGYQAGMGREDYLRPRFKFATTFFPPHRVVIRRRGGKWDLIITPSEPEEFLKALEEVVSKLEQEQQRLPHEAGEDAGKVEEKSDVSLV